MKTIDIVQCAAAAALDKKASRVVCLDLHEVSDLCEMQFICSGENDRQTRAIADAIEEQLRTRMNLRPLAVEGKQTGNWVLLDYGNVLVHIFLNIYRDYYAVDTIWPKARQVPLEVSQ